MSYLNKKIINIIDKALEKNTPIMVVGKKSRGVSEIFEEIANHFCFGKEDNAQNRYKYEDLDAIESRQLYYERDLVGTQSLLLAEHYDVYGAFLQTIRELVSNVKYGDDFAYTISKNFCTKDYLVIFCDTKEGKPEIQNIKYYGFDVDGFEKDFKDRINPYTIATPVLIAKEIAYLGI